MDTSISILTEIPEILHQSLIHYLDTHPTWDQDRVFTVALSLFLLQNESNTATNHLSSDYHACARVYLEKLFQQSEF